MENYIQNIELINKYLHKTLSEKEVEGFENQLETDESFKEAYETHIILLEGLKRQVLKEDILKAREASIRIKWMRFFGISVMILIATTLVYILISNKSTETFQNDDSEKKSIVIDSVSSIKESNIQIKTDDSLVVKDSVIEEVKVVSKRIRKINGVGKSSKKKSQVFKINTEKDTIIGCKEGTKLIIKANSFVDTDGKIVSGNINLKITEFYKLSDMLLANLTTTSNNKQLETGGMLYLEALRGDELLSLKPNSNIEILFPTESKKEGMQLFTGKWESENVNWQLQKEQKSEIDDPLVENIEVTEVYASENVQVPFAVVEQAPIYPGCEQVDEKLQKKCTIDAISKFIQRKFNTEVAEELEFNGRVRINSIFRIDENGDIVSIQSRANHPRFEEEANRVIALLPKMKPGKQRGKAVTVPYSLPIIFQTEGQSNAISIKDSRATLGTSNRIQDSLAVKTFEKKLTTKGNVSVSEVNSYILRTSKLGWVNCDRFINNRNRIKYKLKIKDSKGMIVNMAFKSINSVMPSWRANEGVDFRTVPKGEDVLLIAIKKDNGKLYLDILETITEENPSLDFSFKEVTFAELKKQLKKLDN